MLFDVPEPATPAQARPSRRRPCDDDRLADQFSRHDDDEGRHVHSVASRPTAENARALSGDAALLDRNHHRHGATLAAWFGATAADF